MRLSGCVVTSVRRGFTQSRRQCGTESYRMLTNLARDGRRHALLFSCLLLACLSDDGALFVGVFALFGVVVIEWFATGLDARGPVRMVRQTHPIGRRRLYLIKRNVRRDRVHLFQQHRGRQLLQ